MESCSRLRNKTHWEKSGYESTRPCVCCAKARELRSLPGTSVGLDLSTLVQDGLNMIAMGPAQRFMSDNDLSPPWDKHAL